MRHTMSLLALSAGLATSGAMAEDSAVWKSVGDWEVAIDTTIGNGCYAVASWAGGTVLRIGRNPQKSNFYLLIGNDKWASLQPEQAYDIVIQFGSRTPWEVSAAGLQFNPGETVYLHAQSTQMEFIHEFQRALTMKISFQGDEIDTLKLTGSSRAWDAVEACQRETDAHGAGEVEDPFAGAGASAPSRGSGRKAQDPFTN